MHQYITTKLFSYHTLLLVSLTIAQKLLKQPHRTLDAKQIVGVHIIIDRRAAPTFRLESVREIDHLHVHPVVALEAANQILERERVVLPYRLQVLVVVVAHRMVALHFAVDFHRRGGRNYVGVQLLLLLRLRCCCCCCCGCCRRRGGRGGRCDAIIVVELLLVVVVVLLRRRRRRPIERRSPLIAAGHRRSRAAAQQSIAAPGTAAAARTAPKSTAAALLRLRRMRRRRCGAHLRLLLLLKVKRRRRGGRLVRLALHIELIAQQSRIVRDQHRAGVQAQRALAAGPPLDAPQAGQDLDEERPAQAVLGVQEEAERWQRERKKVTTQC